VIGSELDDIREDIRSSVSHTIVRLHRLPHERQVPFVSTHLPNHFLPPSFFAKSTALFNLNHSFSSYTPYH
jgi:hypothetical protein